MGKPGDPDYGEVLSTINFYDPTRSGNPRRLGGGRASSPHGSQVRNIPIQSRHGKIDDVVENDIVVYANMACHRRFGRLPDADRQRTDLEYPLGVGSAFPPFYWSHPFPGMPRGVISYGPQRFIF